MRYHQSLADMTSPRSPEQALKKKNKPDKEKVMLKVTEVSSLVVQWVRTWCCHCSGLGCCCGSGSTPGPGPPT